MRHKPYLGAICQQLGTSVHLRPIQTAWSTTNIYGHFLMLSTLDLFISLQIYGDTFIWKQTFNLLKNYILKALTAAWLTVFVYTCL